MGLSRALTGTLLASLIGLCGCAVPGARAVPAACEFPDGVPLSFSGQTTFFTLGIPAPGEEHDPIYAWVTAAPISFPSAPEEHRAICVERGDGTFERSAYPGALRTAR